MVYAVIMAGGSGTRFWPKRTQSLPKQFLDLFGEETMIQNTVKRIEPLIPLDRVMVVTNATYTPIIKEQLPEIPEQNIVGEPVGKNTAPCIAIAAELLRKKDPDAVMVVLPADHYITKPDRFLQFLKTAITKAISGNNLVTIGIKPDRPETGFGYIHGDCSTIETLEGFDVHPVKEFTEKPNGSTAEQFIHSGNYFWNSGMFVWTVNSILNEIEQHLPDIYNKLTTISTDLYGDGHLAAIHDFYYACGSISIDYGVMEKSGSVYVVPSEFGWNDVGTWSAVYELSKKDHHGNVVQTTHASFSDAKDNLIVSNSEKMIALVGLHNIAVVETETAILVCDLNSAQGVKQVVEYMKSSETLRKFL